MQRKNGQHWHWQWHCTATWSPTVTSEKPINYDAIDNAPVDIFLAILVPENKASEHLDTLSAIATKLNNKDILSRMRKAKTDQELFEARH